MSLQSFDLTSLADMLRADPEYRDRGDSDDEEVAESLTTSSKYGPGDIGAKCKGSKTGPLKDSKGETTKASSQQSNASQIWDSNEPIITKAEVVKNKVPAQPTLSDSRKTPTYKMHYRQTVTPEDVFLQMGNKTPGSASCESLVIEIDLPEEEDACRNQLTIGEQTLDIRGPIYLLHLGLPHPVDTKAGNAKWNSEERKLIVTLKIVRELDRINF